MFRYPGKPVVTCKCCRHSLTVIFFLYLFGIQSAWRTALHELKIENLHFHDLLRHEAISRFFELGTLNVIEVAAISRPSLPEHVETIQYTFGLINLSVNSDARRKPNQQNRSLFCSLPGNGREQKRASRCDSEWFRPGNKRSHKRTGHISCQRVAATNTGTSRPARESASLTPGELPANIDERVMILSINKLKDSLMIEQLQSDFFILDIYLLPDSRFAYPETFILPEKLIHRKTKYSPAEKYAVWTLNSIYVQ